VRRSTSRSSTIPPEVAPLPLPAAPAGGTCAALTVDVEEWYHNCWAPEYVEPARRPALPEELDRLLPATLERFAAAGARATFFVLGEVARRLPERVRELARAGHEVACHGELHLRANRRPRAEFARDVGTAKARLEDLLGAVVAGFRAPEWSLRETGSPRLRDVAEAGFRYDSSLLPALGAGARGNPTLPARCRWSDGLALVEAPPATWAGALRLPVGGWCGRLAPVGRLAAAAAALAARGGLPVFVVHPWELVDRPCPGLLTGFARFFHEAGRHGFGARFDELLRRVRCDAPLGERLRALPAEPPPPAPRERRVGAGAALATAGSA
jgi:peptidoglycan/xylan/chitin deacetylase (PgdA/CDA1 family)